MKRKIIALVLVVTAALIILSQTVLAIVPGTPVYYNARKIADNLEFQNTISWDNTDGRGESFVLRYTQDGGDAYPIVAKDDTVYGSVTISEAINYAQGQNKTVLAAINSDFFSTQTGVPMGIFIEDGVYKSSPEGYNAVSFSPNSGGISIHKAPIVNMTLNNQGGINTKNAGESVSLTHFNKFRMDTGGLYLFSEHFSTVSTRTSTNGWFVRFKILEGTPTVSGTMRLEVAETLTSDGAITIGEGYLILSAATAGGYGEIFDKFAVGDIVTLTTTCSDPVLKTASYATGAGDMLVENGTPADTSGWAANMKQRAPRTALGLRADGTLICYVIDGRDYTQSVGVLPEELINEMLRQGCVTAINLDGGGSTAISVRFPGSDSCTLVNKPSDGKERKCSTYILFVTDAVSNGKAEKLALKNDGAIVLAGSSVDLGYAAADSGYMPVSVPGDITVTSQYNDAYAAEGVYTAGGTAGTDTLTLHSPSTGANGSGNIVVITEPTSITVTQKGSADKLTSVTLLPGQTLELDVISTYYRRPVSSQIYSYNFEVSGDIGQMTQPGVFTASNIPGASGLITVTAGSKTEQVIVSIRGFDDMSGHWASDYVTHLSRIGVVKGVSETQYGPELEIKRGDFVLMLYRAAGQPQSSTNLSFDDVPSDAYYAQAIAWAKERGIATGTGGGKFNPESMLTRQEAFTFVYRALGILGITCYDGTPNSLSGFSDAGAIEGYALTPTATLVELGVVEGSFGMLTPESTFTRAQMAKVLSVVLNLPRSETAQPGGSPGIIYEPPAEIPVEIPVEAPAETPAEEPAKNSEEEKKPVEVPDRKPEYIYED